MQAELLEVEVLSPAVSFDTIRLDAQKHRVRNLEHKSRRLASAPDVLAECDREALSWPQRASRLVRRMCEAETPVIHQDERIVFTRTTPTVPPIYSTQEWNQKGAGHTFHEIGPISNICADWGSILSQGLLERRRVAQQTRQRMEADPKAVEFLDCSTECIDAVLDLAARYAEEARRIGS